MYRFAAVSTLFLHTVQSICVLNARLPLTASRVCVPTPQLCRSIHRCARVVATEKLLCHDVTTPTKQPRCISVSRGGMSADCGDPSASNDLRGRARHERIARGKNLVRMLDMEGIASTEMYHEAFRRATDAVPAVDFSLRPRATRTMSLLC